MTTVSDTRSEVGYFVFLIGVVSCRCWVIDCRGTCLSFSITGLLGGGMWARYLREGDKGGCL